MRKFIVAACAAAIAVTTLGTSSITAGAAPLVRIESGSGDVLQVQNRPDRRDRFERRRDGNHYYNGRRGYRERRAGYRQYNGFWFPPAAFIAGAIIGGSVATPPRAAVRRSDRHVRWCSDQYRSYRASDNSYQPSNGPRRQCNSPFN